MTAAAPRVRAEPVPVLSVVVPVYDEEAVLPLLAVRLRAVLDALGEPYEVLVVDDGSRDATPAVLERLRAGWPQLRVLRLRRNSGHQAALTAGIDHADGDYVASIDADLQDPPEVLAEMLAAARRERCDVVYAVRTDRSSDSRFKRWTAGAYYRLMRSMAGPQVTGHAGDFRLLSRATVDALRSLPETHRVYRLLVPWLGFPSTEVHYARGRRAAGSTKYPLSKMAALAFDSVTTFSAAPLRLATLLGLSGSALCIALLVTALTAYAIGQTVPGWASLFVAVLFLSSVQLLCLGLLGEYVGRLFVAAQRRPSYFVAADLRPGAGPRQDGPVQDGSAPDALAQEVPAQRAGPVAAAGDVATGRGGVR